MDGDLIEEGLNLLLFGMGTVFSFLIILVLTTVLMSWIVARFFPEAPQPAAPAPQVKSGGGRVDARTLQVIQAAIDRHRGRH